MNEILLLVLAIAGVFSIACSIALISLGTIIDRFPLGDESNRKRSLSSPIESTRIAVVIYWALFIIGGYAILLESKYRNYHRYYDHLLRHPFHVHCT